MIQSANVHIFLQIYCSFELLVITYYCKKSVIIKTVIFHLNLSNIPFSEILSTKQLNQGIKLA